MHLSALLFIKDLLRRANDNREARVPSGELDNIPPVASIQIIRLQSVPDNHTFSKAG